MKKLYFILSDTGQYHLNSRWLLATLCLFLAFAFQAQAQVKEWDKTIGGTNLDDLFSAQQTSDGGYIIGGFSNSNVSGDKSQISAATDYWIVKMNATGTIEWERSYGGDGYDVLRAVRQTRDGGYILGGYSSSVISGDRTAPSLGNSRGSDFWIVKIDAAGNKEWDKAFGGRYQDWLKSLEVTRDGGYILGGDFNYGADRGTLNATEADSSYLLVKLDALGNTQWEKTYGGNGINTFQSVKQTMDGGYIIGGYSNANASGNKSQDSKGYDDYWVVKVDAAGNKMWDKTFGGDQFDYLQELQQTPDGGYILGGFSSSGISGDKTAPSKGQFDYWVVKLDQAGNKIWDRTIGGDGSDNLRSLVVTKDGNILLGGSTNSGMSGDKSQLLLGEYDYWIVMMSASGQLLWNKSFGGESSDMLTTLLQSKDGGYFLAGYSNSGISKDKSEASKGLTDFWVLKLKNEQTTPPPTASTCYDLTFEQAQKGLVTSMETPAGAVAVIGKKRNPDGTYATVNHAAIFDTRTPTGDDADLYTNDWGKVLIINQDLTNTPNDNEWGGELVLDFSAIGPVTMESIKALDIDSYEDRSWVYLYDGAGNELNKVQLQPLGNNSKQMINLDNTKGVIRMRVVLDGRTPTGKLAGSGAINDIRFCIEGVGPENGDDDMKISQVNGYPNPFTDKANIEFRLLQQDQYTVNLYDMKGNLVQELKTGEALAGELNSVEVHSEKLFNGLYFVRIVSGTSSKTIKLILNK